MVSDDPLVHRVETMWRAYLDDGLEAYLALCDDDCDFVPHAGGGRVLHGPDELRAFYAERPNERLEATVYSIERHGDAVLITGALRIMRRGSLTESQLAWVYHFSDGRLRTAVSYPSRTDALRALAVAA